MGNSAKRLIRFLTIILLISIFLLPSLSRIVLAEPPDDGQDNPDFGAPPIGPNQPDTEGPEDPGPVLPPAPEPEPEPAPEPEPETLEPEPIPEPESVPDPAPEPRPDPRPNPETRPEPEPELSDDCSLKSLNLSIGELEPEFSPYIHSYNVELEYTDKEPIDEILIIGRATHPNARVRGNGRFKLKEYGSRKYIIVFAEDGTALRYEINFLLKEKPFDKVTGYVRLNQDEDINQGSSNDKDEENLEDDEKKNEAVAKDHGEVYKPDLDKIRDSEEYYKPKDRVTKFLIVLFSIVLLAVPAFWILIKNSIRS